jgi:hypothetical protein
MGSAIPLYYRPFSHAKQRHDNFDISLGLITSHPREIRLWPRRPSLSLSQLPGIGGYQIDVPNRKCVAENERPGFYPPPIARSNSRRRSLDLKPVPHPCGVRKGGGFLLLTERFQMLLSYPARGLPTLVPLDQNHRDNRHHRRRDKPEWLQHEPQPMKHEEVADSHGDGGQNDDEERAIHGKTIVLFMRGPEAAQAEIKPSRSPSSCPSPTR